MCLAGLFLYISKLRGGEFGGWQADWLMVVRRTGNKRRERERERERRGEEIDEIGVRPGTILMVGN
jgi:hypothetical protein